MNELDLQSTLIRGAKAAGGDGFKLANRFIAGIPDVLLQIPRRPTALIEVKFDVRKTDKFPWNFELSKNQYTHLKDLQAAGAMVGWIFVLQVGRAFHWLVGDHIQKEPYTFTESVLDTLALGHGMRYHGQVWPIVGMLDTLGVSHEQRQTN